MTTTDMTPEEQVRDEQARAAGALMRAKRKEKGMTQEQVAERLGVHKTYVSMLELGRYNPVRSKHADAIVSMLGLTAADLQAVAPDLMLAAAVLDTRPAGDRLIPYVGPLSHSTRRGAILGHIGDDESLAGYVTGDLMAGVIENETLVPLYLPARPGSIVVWHTLKVPKPGQLTVVRLPDGRHAVAPHGAQRTDRLVEAGIGTAILYGSVLASGLPLGPVVQLRNLYSLD